MGSGVVVPTSGVEEYCSPGTSTDGVERSVGRVVGAELEVEGVGPRPGAKQLQLRGSVVAVAADADDGIRIRGERVADEEVPLEGQREVQHVRGPVGGAAPPTGDECRERLEDGLDHDHRGGAVLPEEQVDGVEVGAHVDHVSGPVSLQPLPHDSLSPQELLRLEVGVQRERSVRVGVPLPHQGGGGGADLDRLPGQLAGVAGETGDAPLAGGHEATLVITPGRRLAHGGEEVGQSLGVGGRGRAGTEEEQQTQEPDRHTELSSPSLTDMQSTGVNGHTTFDFKPADCYRGLGGLVVVIG